MTFNRRRRLPVRFELLQPRPAAIRPQRSGLAGFLTTGILLARESNARSGAFAPIADVRGRYTYDNHPMFAATWGIPLPERWAGPGWAFEGYLYVIAAKGRDEVGNPTGAETDLDMQLMVDLGSRFGQPKNRFRVGVEYHF